MKYTFIGWCHKDEHDKVWGVIELFHNVHTGCNKYVTVWGRRGKKLQTKISEEYSWDIDKIIQQKKNKGYITIDQSKLDQVYPEFERDLSKTAVWSIFKL